jgi:hypothetical protein
VVERVVADVLFRFLVAVVVAVFVAAAAWRAPDWSPPAFSCWCSW